MQGAIGDGGVRVPAVTVFGWDDVLCPTTHARLERRREAEVGEAQEVRCCDDTAREESSGMPTEKVYFYVFL